jgi:hypothetical protein
MYNHRRHVQGASTRAPKAQHELRILGAWEHRRELADAIEHALAEREIGAGEANGLVRIYDERLVTIFLQG